MVQQEEGMPQKEQEEGKCALERGVYGNTNEARENRKNLSTNRKQHMGSLYRCGTKQYIHTSKTNERIRERERERESTWVLVAMEKQEHEALQKRAGGFACFRGKKGERKGEEEIQDN